MARPTKRDLEREVAELREDVERDAFLHIYIGGDPELGGYYEWDAERGEYINEHGHTREDAPESGSEFTIEYE